MKKRSVLSRPATAGESAIRSRYLQHGVEAYYREHAGDYQNPHFPEIRSLLRQNFSQLDTSRVLDFAAGSGECTRVLQEFGVTDITGSDPFMQTRYEQQTGRPCLPLSFKDVVKNGLPERYSLIICSFALHLCPEKDLFPLAWNLLRAAPTLVIITPHKRPELERWPSMALVWEDFACTQRGKKVRLKTYQLAGS